MHVADAGVAPTGRYCFTIGLANWTPRGFIGQLFSVVGRHLPPAPAVVPPSRWGLAEYIHTLFGAAAADVQLIPLDFVFRYRSPAHWIEVFRTWYGPVHKAFASLPADAQQRLESDLLELIAAFNTSGDATS